MVSYLRSQFKLDLIHEDESVGVMWLWPTQKHPVLVALPRHRAGYVVSLFWRTAGRTGYHGEHRGLDSHLWLQRSPATISVLAEIHTRKTTGMTLQHQLNMLTTVACTTFVKQITSPLTCRLGSGEDELCCAAALDLSIAGVNVDAVNCERL